MKVTLSWKAELKSKHYHLPFFFADDDDDDDDDDINIKLQLLLSAGFTFALQNPFL